MAIKFQYNKTSLNDLGKQLKMRQRALPTIKSKESALRIEVKNAKDKAEGLRGTIDSLESRYDYMVRLWGEFDPELLTIVDIDLHPGKVAGVVIPILGDVRFGHKEFDRFWSPLWYGDGVTLLEEIARTGIEYQIAHRTVELLDKARKKTTQKVNLYEKVQIPGYQDAIRKIKRFMEDEENLSKSAQKIVKNRHEQQTEEEGTI